MLALPYFEVVRARRILLAAEGLPNDQIDARREAISMWRKRFFEDRLAGLEEPPRPGRPGFFSRQPVAQVKAFACELPATHGLPLSYWNTPGIAQQVRQSGLVAAISRSTIWRWLRQHAIRPWYRRCWNFPRDPQFATKTGRILDL